MAILKNGINAAKAAAKKRALGTDYKGLFSSAADEVSQIAKDAIGRAERLGVGMGKVIGDNFLEYNPKFYNDGLSSSMFGVKFNNKGRVLMAGTALGLGAMEAGETYNKTQLGTPSGEMVSNVPETSYTHFGMETGATGDLVFAMNRNRRG